jgi:hypothetical protein
MNQSSIDFLKQSFHDTPVESLKIDFENESVIILIAVYNESTQEYDLQKLIFEGVERLKMGSLELDFDQDTGVEIYRSEFIQEPGVNKIWFQFLLGFGKPSMDLSFEFDEFVLEKE